jgi:alcohol dehydrogenase class IV
MNFEFASANRIIFGHGQIKGLPELARHNGTSAMVVIGQNSERSDAIRRHLVARGISVTPFHVPHEPTVELAAEGAAHTRYKTCDSVIAIGGGSVMDAAKAIAALATNRRPILDYLEVIGHAQPLTVRPLPVIAIPTTAGSGAEVTRNAVLTSTEHKIKVSLRHPWMAPSLALVDPELTHTMPPAVTAATGLDALSQLIEPFVSIRANPLTDALCREGLDMVGRSLRKAFQNGTDIVARQEMALASLFGGLALANAGLGAVHGFASPFGAMFTAPHGAVCAALLPAVMRMNLRKTGQSARFEEVGRRLTGNPTATANDGALAIESLARDFNIPPLGHYGLTEEHFAELVAKSKNASSMRGNPVPLDDADLTEILRESL